MAKAKSKKITLEEVLVPVEEQPYDVPENWCWVKLEAIASVVTGKKDANYSSEDGEYTFFTCAGEPIRCEGFSFEGESLILPGNGANVGQVFYYNGKFEAYQRTYVLQAKAGNIDLKYLYYQMLFAWNDANKDKQFGSATNYIKMGNFTNYDVPLPPLAEQKRIVEQIENLFAKLDEAREKAQEILDTFNDRKAAILYKAFQGNLTKQWRKEHSDISAIEYLRKIEKSGEDFSKKEFKFWESNELPKTWAESKIGNLLYFAGRIGWKGLKADEYTEEGPLLLSVYNLNDGDEVSYNRVYHITTERYEESPEIMVEIGDVLLTKDGAGIGKLGYVKELPQEATINSSLLLIRPGNTAISKYIFYLLSGPELQSIVKERITGSATPHLFQRDIKEFTIPIPPLEEQEEIVRILDDVLEKEKIAYESAENVISQIELMKKSILAKAFRGELGTNNPEEESSSELLKSIIEGEE